jgi:hypothetical protein
MEERQEAVNVPDFPISFYTVAGYRLRDPPAS